MSLFTGLDHWTGLLDWTTGLTLATAIDPHYIIMCVHVVNHCAVLARCQPDLYYTLRIAQWRDHSRFTQCSMYCIVYSTLYYYRKFAFKHCVSRGTGIYI